MYAHTHLLQHSISIIRAIYTDKENTFSKWRCHYITMYNTDPRQLLYPLQRLNNGNTQMYCWNDWRKRWKFWKTSAWQFVEKASKSNKRGFLLLHCFYGITIVSNIPSRWAVHLTTSLRRGTLIVVWLPLIHVFGHSDRARNN